MLAVWFLGAGLPLPLAVLAACLATAVVGALMERLTIRPLAGAPALNAVIITIGVSIVLRGGAMAYYQLAILWGAVPIIEDNSKLISQPLLYRNKVEDVYKFIALDLTFAAQNLPTSNDAGRVTTWSAQGLLSKVYLTMAGLGQSGDGTRNQAYLDSAKLYAGNVCNKSGLALLDNYADLFKSQHNNNSESLFALQWAPGVGWLLGNMIKG